MVADHLTALLREGGEAARVGLDVEGVLALRLGDDGEGVEGGVPGCVIEYDVAEPVLFSELSGRS